MEYSAFLKICTIIWQQIQVDAEISRHSKSPITDEIMLLCLGGCSYLDIRFCAGISPAAFHSCTYECIDAIWNSEELAYEFPVCWII